MLLLSTVVDAHLVASSPWSQCAQSVRYNDFHRRLSEPVHLRVTLRSHQTPVEEDDEEQHSHC